MFLWNPATMPEHTCYETRCHSFRITRVQLIDTENPLIMDGPGPAGGFEPSQNFDSRVVDHEVSLGPGHLSWPSGGSNLREAEER